MPIGITIRQLRIQKRMSQSLLADLVGVSQGTISNWESDAHYPNAYELTELATVLNVPIAAFLAEAPSPSVSELTQENARLRAQIEQLTQQLVETMNTISRQQKLLATYLQGGGLVERIGNPLTRQGIA